MENETISLSQYQTKFILCRGVESEELFRHIFSLNTQKQIQFINCDLSAEGLMKRDTQYSRCVIYQDEQNNFYIDGKDQEFIYQDIRKTDLYSYCQFDLTSRTNNDLYEIFSINDNALLMSKDTTMNSDAAWFCLKLILAIRTDIKVTKVNGVFDPHHFITPERMEDQSIETFLTEMNIVPEEQAYRDITSTNVISTFDTDSFFANVPSPSRDQKRAEDGQRESVSEYGETARVAPRRIPYLRPLHLNEFDCYVDINGLILIDCQSNPQMNLSLSPETMINRLERWLIENDVMTNNLVINFHQFKKYVICVIDGGADQFKKIFQLDSEKEILFLNWNLTGDGLKRPTTCTDCVIFQDKNNNFFIQSNNQDCNLDDNTSLYSYIKSNLAWIRFSDNPPYQCYSIEGNCLLISNCSEMSAKAAIFHFRLIFDIGKIAIQRVDYVFDKECFIHPLKANQPENDQENSSQTQQRKRKREEEFNNQLQSFIQQRLFSMAPPVKPGSSNLTSQGARPKK